MSFDPEGDSSFTQQSISKNYGAFYREWVRNNFKSKQEGREVGEYQDFVLIISPGQTKTELRTKATEEHKREFPAEWKAYQEGKEQIASGTPIEMLPGLDRGRALSLKALYIMTIEQMRDCSDLALQRVGMGAAELRDRAKKYLEGDAATRKELAEANRTIEAMKQQYAEVCARLALLEAKKPMGRPKGSKNKPKELQE